MISRMQRRLAWLAPLLLAAPLAYAQADKAEREAKPDTKALEQQLEAAQERLEQAAREVADLSMQLSGPAMDHVIRLQSGGPRRAMLGVNLGSSEAGEGVRVVSVSPGGPAAEAGVRGGDVIIAMDGKKVAGGRELVQSMRSVEPGQKVALDVRRDGKPVKVIVVARLLEPQVMMYDDQDYGRIPLPPPPPGMDPMDGGEHWMLGGFGGAEFVTLTPKLGRYFGADKGVLVVRAPEDEGLKLDEGDVVQTVGGREPQNGSHLLRILRSYQPGEKISLGVLRDRKKLTIDAVAPERHHPMEHFEPRMHGPAAPAMPATPAMPPAPPMPPAPRT